MPRQDVPYGGAICRIRERIAEIFDLLGEKLHTINGVPGDGDGNVKIISGSSAVVITNDPTQNEITVSLDNSELPAAAVSSVNGQTGAVALTADDIPSDNGDVQTDIDNLEAADTTLQGNINAEALARQNADSTLQTNINTVTASLPAAAAAAVAADPTVAYINSELVNKVDLSDVSTVETPDTIAKRNGSGRLVAADAASGATDKTLVNANWVSQTGAGAPNNLLHTNGNETKSGTLELTDGLINPTQIIGKFNTQSSTDASSSMWHKFYSWTAASNTANQSIKFNVVARQNTNGYSEVFVNVRAGTTTAKMLVEGTGAPASNFRITRDGTNMIFWIYGYRTTAWVDFSLRATSASLTAVAITLEDPTIDYDEPTTTPTDPNPHTEVYTPS